jgi:hypothetical protein
LRKRKSNEGGEKEVIKKMNFFRKNKKERKEVRKMEVKFKLVVTHEPQVEELEFSSLDELKAKLLELGLIDSEGNPVVPPQE